MRHPLFRAALATALLFAVVTGAVARQGPTQKEHRRGFTAANDDVFSVIAAFYEYDPAFPLDTRVVDTWEADGTTFEKLVFAAHDGALVPGDLARPSHADGPVPAVLLLHGLGNDRDRWWEDDRKALPQTLLRSGIAVFAIDLRYHGERIGENDLQPAMAIAMNEALPVRNRDMIIDSAVDARRALDALREREEIDGDRLAVVGYSMGGMIAVFLSALEESLVGSVVAALPTWPQLEPVDPFHFAPRVRTPMLLQIGRDDWLSSPADVERLRDSTPANLGALRFYDAGHSLPPAFAEDAATWIGGRITTPATVDGATHGNLPR